MIENVTFPLAIAGFALLAWNAVAAARGKVMRWLSATTAIVVVVHVFMVWAYRYEWSFEQATRNGYVGFAIFHAALASIVAATFTPHRVARVCILFAFATVCLGANGAVYRYEVVAIYRIPVHVVTVIGAFLAPRNLRHKTDTTA